MPQNRKTSKLTKNDEINFYKKVGENIVRVRKNKKISQFRLALDAHVDRSYLAEVEEGKANPSVKFLYKVSRGLRVKISELVKGI